MIWHSGGGGPWGTGPRGGGGGGDRGPWGGGRGGGNGHGPSGPPGPRGPAPNLEDLLRRSQDRLRNALPGGFGTSTGIAVVIVIIVELWAANGVYRELPDELGVGLRFGAY